MLIRVQRTLCRIGLGATLIAIGLASGCMVQEDDDIEPKEVHQTDFPTLDYGFGHQTNLLFSFDGSAEDASKWRNVSETGISDDPRVQRFVDCLRDVLKKQRFECETTLLREERSLGYLSEPMYRGGHRLAEAEIVTRERGGSN